VNATDGEAGPRKARRRLFRWFVGVVVVLVVWVPGLVALAMLVTGKAG
jgi:hypothetical protein